MNPIIYYILCFAVLGAIGMAIANRTATKTIIRQRWLKYFMYILITGTVIAAITFNRFPWVAWAIVGFSFIELIKVNKPYVKTRPLMVILSFIVFITIAAGFILYAYSFSPAFLLFIYFQVLIFDGFSQVAGQLWGKRLLWPSVSPTKTVAGLAGGWLCCIIAAALGTDWTTRSLIAGLYSFITVGFFTGLSSFCGDMLASYYKRKVHVKDYSNWLPGQGGFLDRFDSFLFTGFFYYISYMLIFGSVSR